MWIVKAILILVFFAIFWQDYKDRLVFWFLYPIVGALAFLIQFYHTGLITTLVNSGMNLVIIGTILLVSYLYSKTVLKRGFTNHSIGMGDILLFIFLSFTFATVSFVILFVFSLLFSLVIHIYVKNKSKHKDVPLAGYISIFFSVVYCTSFFIQPKYLFAY